MWLVEVDGCILLLIRATVDRSPVLIGVIRAEGIEATLTYCFSTNISTLLLCVSTLPV